MIQKQRYGSIRGAEYWPNIQLKWNSGIVQIFIAETMRNTVFNMSKISSSFRTARMLVDHSKKREKDGYYSSTV